jgi:hypothetical protein
LVAVELSIHILSAIALDLVLR